MGKRNILKNYINDVKQYTKINGGIAGFKYAIEEIRPYNRIKEEFVRNLKKFPHKIIRPSLFEISVKSNIIISSTEEIVGQILPAAALDSLKIEFDKAITEYKGLLKTLSIKYEFSHVSNMALFLYYVIRIKKPEFVIETGVATGQTSFFILKAMNENNFGKLFSTDIRYDAGEIVPDYLKNRWDFTVLKRDSKKSFEKFINNFDKIDIFFHDSDHSYWWQTLEYNIAFNHIKKDGLLISDDIDNSYAFLDFVNKNKMDFYSFFNGGSIGGVIINRK